MDLIMTPFQGYHSDGSTIPRPNGLGWFISRRWRWNLYLLGCFMTPLQGFLSGGSTIPGPRGLGWFIARRWRWGLLFIGMFYDAPAGLSS